jgi:hypothetical protein
VGHPLIHLGYAFEMNSREIAIEALALTSVSYDFLHKYLDDPSYTKPSALKSTSSPLELLTKAAADQRFDGLFKSPGFGNIGPLFDKHEDLVLEYWNAWDLPNPAKQFQDSQDAAIALLVASVKPGTHAYNFFIVHLLTTSHAVRILLPFIPARFHVPLVRQWWLLTLAVYVAELRPTIDPGNISTDLNGKSWKYVEERALTSEWRTDAHFVKGEQMTLFDGALSGAEAYAPTACSCPRHQGGCAHLGRRTRALSGCRCEVCRRLRGLGSFVARGWGLFLMK